MQTARSEADRVVGKKELCGHLSWSRPTLDRRLDRDPNFPVRQRGSAIGGWEFDLEAVDAYLDRGLLSRTAAPAPQEPGTDPAKVHVGEATAKQRLNSAQAALAEDRLRRQRGELVEADAMRMALSTTLAKLGADLTGLPDKIVRELNLPEAAAPRIRSMVDLMRRKAVEELREQLADADPTQG